MSNLVKRILCQWADNVESWIEQTQSTNRRRRAQDTRDEAAAEAATTRSWLIFAGRAFHRSRGPITQVHCRYYVSRMKRQASSYRPRLSSCELTISNARTIRARKSSEHMFLLFRQSLAILWSPKFSFKQFGSCSSLFESQSPTAMLEDPHMQERA